MTETTDQPIGWGAWATRTTAVLAIIATLSSGRWGASNLQAILEQGKVNDTWSYYQADSIKEHDAEHMTALVDALKAGASPQQQSTLDELHSKFAKEAARKTQDKQTRMKHARMFEESRNRMVERGFWFELSFAALQLGVILGTIATAAAKKSLWLAAVVCGVVGMVILFNGFHTVIHAPESWYQGVSEDMGYQGTAPG